MPGRKPSPWISGIVDTLVGAEVLRASSIPHRNRLAVILIDSAFETAGRAYLQNEAKIRLGDSHRHRDNLIATIKARLSTAVDDAVWNNINFYYEQIRCDFYHSSAGKTITDTTLLDYRETAEFVIDKCFGISIRQLVDAQVQEMNANATTPALEEGPPESELRLDQLSGKVDKLLLIVSQIAPRKVEEINEFLKRAGDSLRLQSADFGNILSRNDGSKKLFYFDRENKRWTLSGLGKFKLNQLKETTT
jgi:hypothetical protein